MRKVGETALPKSLVETVSKEESVVFAYRRGLKGTKRCLGLELSEPKKHF